MAITRRQKEVIDFLTNFTQKNGYSPSYEEIAHGLGLTSLATVHKHVTNLQNKGLLQRAHNRSRSIDVLPPRSSKKGFDRLPLLGRIAAGQPIEAVQMAETISLGDIIGNREVFALEVRGDSMRDEHIVPRGRDDPAAAVEQGDGADLRARGQRRHPGQGAGHPAQVRLRRASLTSHRSGRNARSKITPPPTAV
jgi:SOS-response transcriptional repressor LexA